MKRFIKSKNGFTLIEIVIVVSIIVILSSATFVGINQVLDRANRNAQDLEENHGAHFEEEAWATVKNLSVDVDSFKETSETSLTESTGSESTSSSETSAESSVTPNEKDQEFLNRKQDLIDMGYLENEITIKYGPDGHIQSMSWRSTRKGFVGNGYESQGYGIDFDANADTWGFNTCITFDEPIQSCTIQLPAGTSIDRWGYDLYCYDIKDNGDGTYTLTFKPNNGSDPLSEINLYGPNGITIVSFKSAED